MNRSYAWDSKQTFLLSPVELGTLLAAPTEAHSLYHDPGAPRSALDTQAVHPIWQPGVLEGLSRGGGGGGWFA